MLTMLPSLCLISSKQTVSLQRRRSDVRAPGRDGLQILGFCAFAANRSPAGPVIRLWRPGFTGPGRAGFKSWPFCTEQLHSACRVVLQPSNINNNKATLRLCVKSQGALNSVSFNNASAITAVTAPILCISAERRGARRLTALMRRPMHITEAIISFFLIEYFTISIFRNCLHDIDSQYWPK